MILGCSQALKRLGGVGQVRIRLLRVRLEGADEFLRAGELHDLLRVCSLVSLAQRDLLLGKDFAGFLEGLLSFLEFWQRCIGGVENSSRRRERLNADADGCGLVEAALRLIALDNAFRSRGAKLRLGLADLGLGFEQIPSSDGMAFAESASESACWRADLTAVSSSIARPRNPWCCLRDRRVSRRP